VSSGSSSDGADAPAAQETERASAWRALTLAIRRLCDASIATAVPEGDLERARERVEAVAALLARESHEDTYSGLHRYGGDMSSPHTLLPLSPIVGGYNPLAPDLELAFRDGRVVGSATLGRKYVGPPNAVHGGVSAMLADQLLSLVPPARGLRMVTKSIRVAYKRHTPLDTPLELEAWCEEVGEGSARALCEIRANGKVTVEGEGELVAYVPRSR
jgi:acyl-coenzyme A thioesterase PaaI-like protein